jgi:hypothetical protein
MCDCCGPRPWIFVQENRAVDEDMAPCDVAVGGSMPITPTDRLRDDRAVMR